ncbi:hypothetical protein C8R43DRAFT_1035544 [Mycena crocata]|nr:hypothetical protein C8R43DRAFT_1035544 [Mycena crocata]
MPPTKREILLACLLFIGLSLIYTPEKSRQFISAPESVYFPAVYRPPKALATSGGSQSHYAVPKPPGDSPELLETKILAHVPGWSLIDRLYLFKGVAFIVTNEPDTIPDLGTIYSKGLRIQNGKEAELARLPDDTDIRIISATEAKALFKSNPKSMDGVTYWVNDHFQFIRHYYHWSAELWFGFWRTYSSLDPSISASGNTTLPPPRRILFPRLDAFFWRDYATMNQWVVRSCFPEATMEFIDDWDDRVKMGVPWVLERVVISDRSAAMPALNYQRFQRTAAAAFALPGSPNSWMTIRNNVVQFAGIDPEEGAGTMGRPVITYISRQAWGRRMLIQADHENLVRELLNLEKTYGYEVNIVVPEYMTRVEQLRLAARTTIMMGVHGNGLTSLLWMKPNPRSTVMEFFFPGGFAHDYEYTARSLGIRHYGFWGSTSFTSPGTPLPAYPEGFQGNFIPIDGEAVARLCIQRITLEEEVDEG